MYSENGVIKEHEKQVSLILVMCAHLSLMDITDAFYSFILKKEEEEEETFSAEHLLCLFISMHYNDFHKLHLTLICKSIRIP